LHLLFLTYPPSSHIYTLSLHDALPISLSNKHGVSLDPISRNEHAHRVMSFLALDDPGHLRLRTLVSKGFTPRRIRELESRVTEIDRKSTRLNSSHSQISYAVFCLKKKT